LDRSIGNVTRAIQRRPGMWKNLLLVFLGDNGGAISKGGNVGGNNWPLTGGKYNNWEGGIRTTSFISGGYLPKHRRGTTYEGLVAGWDWYATFSSMAGVDPHKDAKAEAANLPPVDSIDLTSVILGERSLQSTLRPRTTWLIGAEPAETNFTNAPLCSSYHMDEAQMYDEHGKEAARRVRGLPKDARCTTVTGVILDDGKGHLWKLMTGDERQYIQTGPHYPNSTTGDFNSQDDKWVRHCGDACLYELYSDPAERHDLAAMETSKPIIAHLRKIVEDAIDTAYNPHRGKDDPRACKAAERRGGFWGPFINEPN